MNFMEIRMKFVVELGTNPQPIPDRFGRVHSLMNDLKKISQPPISDWISFNISAVRAITKYQNPAAGTNL